MTTNRLIPTRVRGDMTFVALAAGECHTCGIASSGGAHCRGGNAYGQLGDGTTTRRLVPAAVVGGLDCLAAANPAPLAHAEQEKPRTGLNGMQEGAGGADGVARPLLST